MPWQKKKDLLVLFTDGIVDARNAAGARLGEPAILEVIVANRSSSPKEIVDAVFEVLHAHSGDTPSPDDLTLLVLRS
jgi:sigma-B regulation protein RsbU (phosphoserine phosphatase)